jgi:hypothetical protein
VDRPAAVSRAASRPGADRQAPAVLILLPRPRRTAPAGRPRSRHRSPSLPRRRRRGPWSAAILVPPMSWPAARSAARRQRPLARDNRLVSRSRGQWPSGHGRNRCAHHSRTNRRRRRRTAMTCRLARLPATAARGTRATRRSIRMVRVRTGRRRRTPQLRWLTATSPSRPVSRSAASRVSFPGSSAAVGKDRGPTRPGDSMSDQSSADHAI